MTDITGEQRAAVEWLQRAADPAVWERNRPFLTADRARVILDALPSELTSPQPVLPAKRGLYLDKRGYDGPIWRIDRDGGRLYVNGHMMAASPNLAPFTRLVPERPQITREQIADHLAACSELPRLSNLDMADSILALVNGADRD